MTLQIEIQKADFDGSAQKYIRLPQFHYRWFIRLNVDGSLQYTDPRDYRALPL